MVQNPWHTPQHPRTVIMRTADLMLQDFDLEISNTRRTLERVPEDQPDWTPHPKSMPGLYGPSADEPFGASK